MENGPEGEAEHTIVIERDRKLLRSWGGIFRFLFIAAIGVGAYLVLDPPSIADRPLSALTLRDVGKNVAAALVAVWCVKWFLDFPEEYDGESIALESWGKFGTYVIGGLTLLVLIILTN